MKGRTKILIGFIPLFICVITLLYIFSISKIYVNLTEDFLKKESEEIIEQIDGFKEKNNYYPETITELGYKEHGKSGQISYQVSDSGYYTLLYQHKEFESMVYNSLTKEWNISKANIRENSRSPVPASK